MIVKVCGMREAENIRAVEQTGADWMGFIFFEGSPRYVSEVPEHLPEDCARVGVFVDAKLVDIIRKINEYGLQYVQLHGNEKPDNCRTLQKAGVKVIKAFNLAKQEDLNHVGRYDGVCDYYLFDTATPDHGRTPFLLSGGLGPDSLGQLSRFRHPRWAGIDLNSRFETEPGIKDADLLGDFITQFKQLTYQYHEQNKRSFRPKAQ
jgi:phosphoribosylanthranilate isomerase